MKFHLFPAFIVSAAVRGCQRSDVDSDPSNKALQLVFVLEYDVFRMAQQ